MKDYKSQLTTVAQTLGIDIIDYDVLNSDVIEISIARQDFNPVDLTLVETVAQAFAEAVDYEISLDIGSAGAEREIQPEHYVDAVEQYVFVSFTRPFEGGDSVEGILVSADDASITIKYRVKTRDLTIEIPRTIVKMLRLAVRV